MKDNHVWNISRPPAPGWYHASALQNNALYRWWNGECWSDFATKNYTADEAAERAKVVWTWAKNGNNRVYWREIERTEK